MIPPLCVFRRTPETKLSSASERLHDEEEENVENSILFPHSYIFYFSRSRAAYPGVLSPRQDHTRLCFSFLAALWCARS